MTTTQLAAWVMLAFGGLYSGAILIYAVDRVHVWRRMPIDQYVIDFRRSLFRADPLMPIMGIVTELGTVVFALHSGDRAAALAWTGWADCVDHRRFHNACRTDQFEVSTASRGPG